MGTQQGLEPFRRCFAAVAIAVGCGPALGCDMVCDGHDNDPAGEFLTLRYQNDRGVPMFLGMPASCQEFLPFDVTIPGQTPMSIGSSLYRCEICEDIKNGEDSCPAPCPDPPMIRLEAGGFYDIVYDARQWGMEQMPDSCHDGDGDVWCKRHIEIRDGTYDLVAYGWDGCEDDSSGTEGCSCEANSDGWCKLDEPWPAGTQLSVETTFDYPPSAHHPVVTQIDLSFQP